MGQPIINRLIFDQFDIKHRGEYMNRLLSKTHVGMVVKAEMLWVLAVQTETHGVFHGCLHGSVVCGRLLSKTHGLNAMQSKTHWVNCIWIAMAYQREDFQKKSRFKTLMKTMPEPYDFDASGLGRVGEYFPNFLIKTHRGSMEKVKTF